MDREHIGREVNSFIENLKKEFNPQRIIIFGSHAKGDNWKRSDYDFIIVSSLFENVHWLERISSVVKYWELLCNVDILPYTPEEFEVKRKQIGIVRTAVEEGVELL